MTGSTNAFPNRTRRSSPASTAAPWLLALLLVSMASSRAHAQTEIIVRLEAPTGEMLRAPAAALGLGGEQVARFDARLPGSYVVRVGPDQDAEAVLAELRGRSDVAYAIVPQLLSLGEANEPEASSPSETMGYGPLRSAARAQAKPFVSDSSRHLLVVGAPDAWRVTPGSESVRLAVVDTGVDRDHPALRGQLWVNPGEDIDGDGRFTDADRNGVDDDGNGLIDDVQGYDFVSRSLAVGEGDLSDPDPDAGEDPTPGPGRGHGTTVAGAALGALASGEAFGVAPGVRLVPIRAFGSDGQGEDDDIARGILYAADLGVDVLNLSFGDVYQSPLVRDAVGYAWSQGVFITASAGNRGIQDPHYPSDYPEVVSVGWLTSDGTSRAGFADFGPNLELGAPAQGLYVPVYRPDADEPQYARLSGSSLAAPQVAGAAALLRSLDGSLSPAALRSILTGAARDIEEPGYDEETGHGLLQAGEALRRALPGRIEIASPLAEGGTSADRVAVVGTVLDPAFERFVVEVQPYDRGARWQELARSDASVLADTLAVWDASDAPDGLYLIRVRVERAGLEAVERRVRFVLDRSAPRIEVRYAGPGVRAGASGLWLDVATSDDASLGARAGARQVESDRIATVHGLFVPRTSPSSYAQTITLTARNVAGLTADTTLSVRLPADRYSSTLLQASPSGLPAGHLLPTRHGRGLPDFNGNGLPDVALNAYQDEAIGDTLIIADLSGGVATRGVKLVANVLPRDWGDADGDGSLDLLTQVSGATLLLGSSDGGYPVEALFQDTTGLSRDSARARRDGFLGAAIVDLDRNGTSELLGRSDTAWQVVAFDGSAWTRRDRLDNPTPVDSAEFAQNELSDPNLAFGTFDGRYQAVAIDAGADLFAFTLDDGTLRSIWTQPQQGYAARARLATGDADGDGDDDLVSMRQNWTGPRSLDNEREPQASIVTLWRDGRERAHEIALAGPLRSNTAAAMYDLTGDGAAEVIVSQEPFLYVFEITPDGLAPLWSLGDRPGDPRVIAPELPAHDFDGDGTPELLVSTSEGTLVLRTSDAVAVPQVEAAYPLGPDRVRVVVRAPSADSVEVWSGEGEAVARLLAATGDTLDLAASAPQSYRVRSVTARGPSAFAPPVMLTPRPLAQPLTSERVGADQFAFAFSAAVDASEARAAVTGSEARARVQLGADPARVVVTLPDAGPNVELCLSGVRDAEGAPLPQLPFCAAFQAFEPDAPTLVIARATPLGDATVRLTFSAPVAAALAEDAGAYRVAPFGSVASATLDPDDPASVVLTLVGAPQPGIGMAVSITARGIRGRDGQTLLAEGATVSLGAAAESLDDAFVYPNPTRRANANELTIGKVPAQARVTILTAAGALVADFDAVAPLGGVRWDLTDREGRSVPAGVYLIRIETPDGERRILKAALL